MSKISKPTGIKTRLVVRGAKEFGSRQLKNRASLWDNESALKLFAVMDVHQTHR